MWKLVTDVTDMMAISREEVALQHQLLVSDMKINILSYIKVEFTPPTCPKVWDDKDPSDMKQSFIVLNYKGTDDSLNRGNYRGLKLSEQP